MQQVRPNYHRPAAMRQMGDEQLARGRAPIPNHGYLESFVRVKTTIANFFSVAIGFFYPVEEEDDAIKSLKLLLQLPVHLRAAWQQTVADNDLAHDLAFFKAEYQILTLAVIAQGEKNDLTQIEIHCLNEQRERDEKKLS